MRARLPFIALATLAFCACAHEERRPAHEALPPVAQNSPPASPKSAYVIADPEPNAVTLPLGGAGIHGLVVDRHRFVIGQGEPRLAPDVAPTSILGASKIPGRLGGGFLFWTSTGLYRADRFDGRLTPIARVPTAIASVSFGPKSVLVHAHEGGRWAFALPSGERVPITPLGMTDVASLDDGRALAWNDQGFVVTSTDHGAHWTDVTVQVQNPPYRITSTETDLSLVDVNNAAARVESDGRLSAFDVPDAPPVPEFRPKDVRWRGNEPPLRAAFHSGAALDDSTALVMNAGNVVRVDLRTGALLSVTAGRLPPDAECQGTTVPGDVVFACMTANGSAFVVSRTSSSDGPAIEQSFPSGGRFVAGDDGGLAYVGSCRPGVTPAADASVVCVRTPSGIWEERDLSRLAASANAPDLHVGHWVPRVDGHAVALLVGTPAGIYDPTTNTVTPFDSDATENIVREDNPYILPILKKWKAVRMAHPRMRLIDTAWTFTAGDVLRGWRPQGGSVELSPSGKLTPSSYTFDVAQAGATALGRSKDGRLYQSIDHGASWNEVDPPPAGVESLEIGRCSSAGCDLGSFYRAGWSARSPEPALPPSSAAVPSAMRRVRGLELACKMHAPAASKVLARTAFSPDDLGLGNNRLPVANEKSDWSYLRNLVPRAIVNPVRAMPSDGDENLSLRAIFSGFGTSDSGDVLSVTGPNKNVMNLRRDVAFVAPFDPTARIVRTSIAMNDVVAAGRRAGMTTEEILGSDFTESGLVIPLTSADPSASSEIAIHNSEHGLLAIARGDRARVVIRPPASVMSVVSGVVFGPDEAAFLEIENSGLGRVFKVSSSGVADLFEVNSAANDAYYPPNVDALAVGPKGELAIIRTPSGAEPASLLDPAFLISPGAAATALAPWSQLALADDPACKADTAGYRAVLQLSAPWIRVTSPDLHVDETQTIARVRWSTSRVCLEGFEVRLPSANVRMASISGGSEVASVGTWLVGKGSTFARVGVGEGIEWRQPLECSIAATGP